MTLRIASLALIAALAAAGCSKGPKTEAKAAPAATAAKPADGAATAAKPADGTASAAKPEGTATPTAAGQSFGAGVKLPDSTPIATILANPKDYAGKTVRAEGMIVDVCPKRGCWFEMAGPNPGEKLRFKVVDGEMVFPLDAKGKWAVAEGVLSVDDMAGGGSVAYGK